jgi:hypothetical protein
MTIDDIRDRINADDRSYYAIAKAAGIDNGQLLRFAKEGKPILGGEKLLRLLPVLGLMVSTRT